MATKTKVQIFERTSCCTPSESADLVSFLNEKFEDNGVEVEHHDLKSTEGEVSIPRDLLMRLHQAGTSVLPAFVVDGEVAMQGGLPNFLEAIRLINDEPEDVELPIVKSGSDGCC